MLEPSTRRGQQARSAGSVSRLFIPSRSASLLFGLRLSLRCTYLRGSLEFFSALAGAPSFAIVGQQRECGGPLKSQIERFIETASETMSAPTTPTQSNASHRHSVVLEMPLDIPSLKEMLDRLKAISNPVAINKYITPCPQAIAARQPKLPMR